MVTDRYLTERECFRLMGFDDSDFDKLIKIFPRRKNCMSSILYKQAGNSIVVDVLEEIIKEIHNCSLYFIMEEGGKYEDK